MFKKLQREITIYNAIILILFLITFCVSIYFFMKSGIDASVERALKGRISYIERIAKDRMQNPLNVRFRPSKDMEHRTTNKGSIFDMKMRVDIMIFDNEKNVVLNTNLYLDSYIKEFGEIINNKQEELKQVKIDDKEYMIYVKKFKSVGDYYIIGIHDYEITKSFLFSIVIMILFVSSFAMIILLFISRLFAKRAIIPIQMSWDKQKKFVADASHELRTPLSVMQINLEAALSDGNSTIDDNRIWLNNTLEEANLMTNLVNDLLLLANIDSNQIHYEFVELDFSKLINNTIDRVEDLAFASNVHIYRDIDEGIYTVGDRSKLMQLITILLDNGIKYNKPSGSIFVRIIEDSGYVELTIRDTGIGINKKNLNKIFDRFFMEDKARSNERGSSGLGLSIAKWIVNIHGGKIKANSKLDEGSIFTIRFKSKSDKYIDD